jgi:SagB-type dehydrogenase family enzyme
MLSTDDLREQISDAAYLQTALSDAPAVIVVATNYRNSVSRYKEKGKKFVHMDCGHSGQNIYLMAAALGLGTVAIGAFDEEAVGRILQLPHNEVTLYLFPVGHPK